ncbi:MAG: phosphodiester glycosidase family protein [Syntrophobacteraceae bacterium]
MRVLLLLKILASCLAAICIIVLSSGIPFCATDTSAWKEADEGLLVAEFESTFQKNPYAVTAIKMDPGNYSLSLLCASEHGKESLTAKEWSSRFKLHGAINAGMFQENGLTSVGFMKNFGHVNNPRLSRANTILAFNPTAADVPQVHIIDRECQDFDSLRQKYQSFVQSIRMISCNQKNVWEQQNSKWSTAAIGMDADGNVLFLFSRTPHTVHDFIEILLSLPLSLKSAMYLEGGPQASLYLSTSKVTLERNGVWEGLEENGAFQFSLPIPNVIGIVKKQRGKS